MLFLTKLMLLTASQTDADLSTVLEETKAVAEEVRGLLEGGGPDFIGGADSVTVLGAGAETAGQAAFRAHGLTGARGEAASGFRREREELTALRALLAEGRSLNDAMALVLLRLIARAEDTNIVKRRGRERLDQVHREAEELLAGEGPSWEDLLRLDESFIREGLSPGGCADLLAVVCFFFFWEEQEKAGA